MPTKLSALTQATILGAADRLYAAVGGNSRAIPALALAGRNRIINGTGRINQRGYVSGTATTAVNQYTLDRWRVVVLGQNLTFTGTDAGRTMTAPAGGVEQVIEGANIEGGSYVINWAGTATCTVDGVGRGKGATFTLTAGSNVTVRFTGGTFTEVQLEAGTMATPFEHVLIGDDLARCQRYYSASIFNIRFNATAAGQIAECYVYWPVQMRAVPVVSLDTTGTFNGTPTAGNPGIYGVRASMSSAGSGDVRLLNAPITANAEL